MRYATLLAILAMAAVLGGVALGKPGNVNLSGLDFSGSTDQKISVKGFGKDDTSKTLAITFTNGTDWTATDGIFTYSGTYAVVGKKFTFTYDGTSAANLRTALEAWLTSLAGFPVTVTLDAPVVAVGKAKVERSGTVDSIMYKLVVPFTATGASNTAHGKFQLKGSGN